MGLTLKEWRSSKGWSQEKLAATLKELSGEEKVGQTHVSAYERGIEPGWAIGMAITKLTRGKVTPRSFARKAAPPSP